MKRETNTLGLGTLIFALLLLFNPNISVIDLLPDFIGYILLCRALSKWADLQESIGEAVALFGKMILVDAGKWLALLWVFGMSVTGERNSSLLLWTFVFSVLELIFLIPAYSKLFDGITQLGYFYPNTSIFSDQSNPKQRSRTDRMKRCSIAFVIVKAVLSALPEFVDLTNASYDEGSTTVNLYRYIGLMRTMAFIPVLIFGLIWLCRMQAYFCRLRKDEPLMAGLGEQYRTKILPKVGLFVRRDFAWAYALFVIALCLTADFRLDGQNCIPDFLAAIFFFAFFLVLRKRTKLQTAAWLGSTVLYFGLSLVAAISEYSFFAEYYYGAVIKNEAAMIAYGIMMLCNMLKLLSFLLLLWIAIRSLRAVILTHTGYVAGKEIHSEREEKMVHSLQKELWHALIWALVSAVLYAIADACYDLLVSEFAFYGMIVLAFAALCVACFVRAMAAIRHAVDTKYMLE